MAESVNLTTRLIELAQPPEKGQRFIRDTGQPGLALRVTASGTKSFVVEAWVNGRSRRRTIAKVERIQLKDARRQAKQFVGEFAQGMDVVAEERNERKRSTTLAEVMEQYLQSRNLSPKTVRDYRGVMERTLADWQRKPVMHITRDMVQQRHAKITKDNGPALANMAMRVLRAVLNYAAASIEDENGRPIITDNPVIRISATRSWNRIERRRTLIRPHDLPAWWRAVEALEEDPRDSKGRVFTDDAGHQIRKGRKAEVVRDYLKFLLLTGLRREEAAQLRWSDVSLAGSYFTIPNTKNHEPHTLPLSDYLQAMLERRQKGTGSVYVFPSTGATGHLIEPRKQMAKVIKQSGVQFTIHDLRRTFVTIAEGLDIPAYALKRLLNHKNNSDVTGGYIIVDTERLRPPMQKVTDFVLNAAGLYDSTKGSENRG